MPNPGHSPTEYVFPLRDARWRVSLRYIPGTYEYAARMQRRVAGGWQNTGPTVRGRSMPAALGALVLGYRALADGIEAAYLFEGLAAIEDGCPGCGYAHPHLSARDAGASRLHCPICGRLYYN